MESEAQIKDSFLKSTVSVSPGCLNLFMKVEKLFRLFRDKNRIQIENISEALYCRWPYEKVFSYYFHRDPLENAMTSSC